MPSLQLIAAPTVEPVTLAECKKHARVNHTADDAYITDLIPAARDKFERETGQYFAEQTWEWTDVPAATQITLPLRRIDILAAIAITDGDEQTVPETYSLMVNQHGQGTITFGTLPTGPLKIQFAAGHKEPYPAWVTATAYTEGDTVIHGGVLYTASSDHTSAAATEPGAGVDWEDVWGVSLEPQPAGAPALAKLAIKSLVAHWYNNREAYIASQHGDLRAVPASYLSILQNFR